MRWLRLRQDKAEQAWASDKWTARDKGRALHILGDAVVLVRHPYDRDPASGAGNCWRGSDEAGDRR